MENNRWKYFVYGASLLLIILGSVLNWMRLPYGDLLTNLGFTPYVALKLAAFAGYPYRDWDWTDKIRFALALFLAAMLVLRYLRFYNSDYYFMLALVIDYIASRQLSVRRGES